jgi:hypothetical protein
MRKRLGMTIKDKVIRVRQHIGENNLPTQKMKDSIKHP